MADSQPKVPVYVAIRKGVDIGLKKRVFKPLDELDGVMAKRRGGLSKLSRTTRRAPGHVTLIIVICATEHSPPQPLAVRVMTGEPFQNPKKSHIHTTPNNPQKSK